MLYRGGFYRGGIIHMSALAGIDQALWDIKGKHLGVPVSQLLGGNVRDRIRVYSWIGGDRPADTAAAARSAVERGFTAVKMNGTEELQYIDSFDKVEKCLENVAAVRDAVGPNVGIGVDFHGRVHKAHGQGADEELDPYKLMFIEEPVLSEHYEALKELARADVHAHRAGRAAVLALGLQAGAVRRLCGHHPAGSVARRRHHRNAQDRRHGRGL